MEKGQKNKNERVQMGEYQILPPFANDVKFERFVVDLFNVIKSTDTFSLFGRKGQKQHGLDISSIEEKTVIQCKLKDIQRDDNKNRNELLEDLENDFAEFVQFNKDHGSHFTKFIFASTFKNDTVIQIECNKKSTENNIVVDYWCWDRLLEYLDDELIFKYYPGFIQIINNYYETAEESSDRNNSGEELKSTDENKAIDDKLIISKTIYSGREKLQERLKKYPILDKIHFLTERFYPLTVLKQNSIPDLFPFNENLNHKQSHYINRYDFAIANDEIAQSLEKWNKTFSNSSTKKVQDIFSFLGFNLIRKISGIKVKEFELNSLANSCSCLLCAFNNFNLKELDKRIINNNSDYLKTKSIQEQLENAYINFRVLNFADAFNQLKQILELANNDQNEERKQITEFLCKSNLQNLYWLCKNTPYTGDSQRILEELEEPNLYNYLFSENIDKDVRTQLEYMSNGKFIKSISYKIDKSLSSIRKSVDSNRNVQFHIAELLYNLGFLYTYIKKNYLFYDVFDDFKVVVEKSIDGIFAAYSVQDNVPTIRNFDLMFGSYTKIEIDDFIQSLCIFYCDTKNLILTFKRYDIQTLPISSEQLIEKAINLCHSPELFDKFSIDNDYRYLFRNLETEFENILFLVSQIEDNPGITDLFRVVINLLANSRNKMNLLGFRHLLAEKRKFIKSDDLIKLLTIVIRKYPHEEKLLNNIVFILEKKYPNEKLSDISIIDDVLKSQGVKSLFLIWFVSDINLKARIEEIIINSLKEKFNFSIYIDCSLNEILSYNLFFDDVLEYIKKSKAKGLYEKVGNTYNTDDYNDFNYFIQLVYTFNIQIPQKYLFEFEKYSDYHKFLLNPEKFDYSSFNIEWLFVFQTKSYWERFKKIKNMKKTVKTELDKNFSKELAEIFYKYLK
nr:hypothetical protein [uncultured Draconibacterium sp.]